MSHQTPNWSNPQTIQIEATSENLDLVYEAVESYKWSIQQLARQLTNGPITQDNAILIKLKDKVARLRELEFMIADIQEGFDENWSSNAVLNRAADVFNPDPEF